LESRRISVTIVTGDGVTMVTIKSQYLSHVRTLRALRGKDGIEAVLGQRIEGAGQLRLDTKSALVYRIGSFDSPVHAAFRFEQFQWGLLPSWTKNPKASRRPINVRAETVTKR
jgi:putative SOS response-associated peptidase YedK